MRIINFIIFTALISCSQHSEGQIKEVIELNQEAVDIIYENMITGKAINDNAIRLIIGRFRWIQPIYIHI
jgi:hypothetical protein